MTHTSLQEEWYGVRWANREIWISRPGLPTGRARHSFRLTSFIAAVILVSALIMPESLRAQESLKVMERWIKYTDLENALYHQFSARADSLLDARRDRVATLDNEGDWRRRQEEIREKLHEMVGPFPARTPLNARVTGIVEKSAYRVENVVFESRPNFYVTSSLFVPNGAKKRAPAILYLSGHFDDGYRGPMYRSICANLASKGFVVLAIDPLGQGERLQYFDSESGASNVGIGVREHSYAGTQAFVTGSSIERYFIWDGIRAIDYLIGRQEVDSTRLGIMGHSGGGTQTALIAAFDERIAAAAPENYITSQRRLFESIGPQDAEQNLYHGIANGIDHADLLIVRAPRPTLVVATTNDFFSIQGTRETYAEVSEAYTALGRSDAVRMTVDTDVHTSTKRNREAVYTFFQEVLENPGDPTDREVPELSADEMRVTETGQVASSTGGETVFSLNRAFAERRLEQLDASRRSGDAHVRRAVESARALSGYREPGPPPEPVYTGRHLRDGYAVEKHFVQGEGDYVIPFLLMVPDGPGPFPAIVYLHPEGKAVDAEPGGKIEEVVREGYIVLAPDLVGTGETGIGRIERDLYRLKMGDAAYNVWFAAVQVGRSIVGLRAGDVVCLVRLLESRSDVVADAIGGVAQGSMGPVLLHAAAFYPSISNALLIEPLVSYASFVTSEFYRPEFVHATVAGALTAYDLPDLAAAIAPRGLTLAGVMDAWGVAINPSDVEKEYRVAVDAYTARGVPDALRVLPAVDNVRIGGLLGH